MKPTLSFATGVTRYGAGTATPQQACAVLRAKARAQGLVLLDASPVDLVAAAITADAWMLLTGATSFNDAPRYGHDALLVLSAALHRAAGQGSKHVTTTSDVTTRLPRLAVAVDDYHEWAREQLGVLATQALLLVVSDLILGGEASPFAQLAEMLRITLDTADTDPS